MASYTRFDNNSHLVRCWQLIQPTPARNAPAVVIQQKKTANHKVGSSVWNVDIQKTPT